MSLFADKRIVSVLMFHSVGLENHEWVFSYTSQPTDLFLKKLKLFVKRKFNTILWSDLYGYMKGEITLPKNCIMLTFDDGYLDNWVYVYPYLKKFQLKATIFVNPEFVDPSESLRPNLDDVWAGRCGYKKLQPAGFLSWAEMKEMESSGLIDIQSHALTHTWYFNGPKIIDFHSPLNRSPYPWLFWNEKPERKPFYISENQEGFIPYGHPVFENEKALVARRYFPDERYVNQIVNFAVSKGKDFFQKKGWKEELKKYSNKIKKSNTFEGSYETLEERYERIRGELSESKALIENKLDKRVDYICWPGGGYDDSVKQIARKIGYKAWTLSSKDLSGFRNLPGTNFENIKRIGTNNRIKIKGYGNTEGGVIYQLLRIQAHKNSYISKQLLRAYKFILTLAR